MWIQVLGSGCSAGFPAWNEGSEAAARARANDPSMPIREAAALAISADGEHYSILEAPLHLPSTLARAARFAPRRGTRGDSYYVHLAGGNPACDSKSPESERIRAADIEIAVDGQEFEL
jgi:hypothetical protein